MPAQDKVVKITIAVDEASAAKARRAISEITQEVSRLVAETNKVGGLFGGGGGGARVGSIAGAAGTSSSTQVNQKMAGSAGGLGNIIGGLTGAATGTASIFRGASDQARQSFKTMQDGLKGLADAGERETARIARAVGRVGFLFQGAGGGLHVGSPLQQAGMAESGRVGGIDRAPRTTGFGGYLNKVQSAVAAGGMMDIGKALLPAGGVVAAGVGAFNMLSGAVYGTQNANLGYNINSPLYSPTAAGQIGGVFGGAQVALRNGSISRALATSQAMRDGATAAVTSQQARDDRETQRERKAPTDLLGHIRKEGLISGFKNDYISNQFGAEWEDLKRGRFNIIKPESWLGKKLGMHHAPGVERADVIQLKGLQAREAVDQANAMEMVVRSYQDRDPLFMQNLDQFYGGSLGDVGLSRGAGISGAFGRRKNGTYFDSVAEFNAGALRMGVSGGERAGFRQQMGATAGRGFFYHGDSLLGPQAGGLGNAAQIYGAGAQFGGGTWGGARSFMGNIQRQIGRGGVDVTAGSQIAGLGVGAMSSGNFTGTSGEGMMSTLLEAGYGGNTGRDMRLAAVVGAGLGAANRATSGSIDPLQQALNFSAALQVGGDLPWSTKSALTKLNTESILDIVRTGKVSGYLSSQGVTVDMVKKYAAATDRTAFARAISRPGYLTDDQRKAVSMYQSAGGSTRYMAGMSDKQKTRQMNLLASTLALTTGDSEYGALGRIRIQAARENVLDRPRGHGAGDPVSHKSTRFTALNDQGVAVTDTGTELAESEGKDKVVSGAIGGRRGAERGAGSERKKSLAGLAAGGIDGALANIQVALEQFVTELRGLNGGAGAPPSNSSGR